MMHVTFPGTMAIYGIWLTLAVLRLSANYAAVLAEDAGVLVDRSAAQSDHHRVQREISQDMTGFNEEEKLAILQKHNELRKNRSASDMMYMEWNDELAKSAQNWAEHCTFKHSTKRKNVAGFRYVGENIYSGSNKFDPVKVVQIWYNEINHYTYETRKCTKVCGHYTQVVWASSRALGCGVKYCPKLERFRAGRGYMVVCQYGPGGNVKGQKPYNSEGKACSQCPKGAQYCIDGLCSVRSKMGGSKATRSVHISLHMITASVVFAVIFLRIFA